MAPISTNGLYVLVSTSFISLAVPLKPRERSFATQTACMCITMFHRHMRVVVTYMPSSRKDCQPALDAYKFEFACHDDHPSLCSQPPHNLLLTGSGAY